MKTAAVNVAAFSDTFLYILYHTAYSSAKTSSALEETITS